MSILIEMLTVEFPENFPCVGEALVFGHVVTRRVRNLNLGCATSRSGVGLKKPFVASQDAQYQPEWAARAGSPIAGGWLGCLDGVQGDQDFLHKIFKLQRIWGTKHSLVLNALQCFPPKVHKL